MPDLYSRWKGSHMLDELGIASFLKRLRQNKINCVIFINDLRQKYDLIASFYKYNPFD